MLAPFSEKGRVPGTLPGPPQATEDSSQRGRSRGTETWVGPERPSGPSRRPLLIVGSPPNCCSKSGNQIINKTSAFTSSLLCARAISKHLTSRSPLRPPSNPYLVCTIILPISQTSRLRPGTEARSGCLAYGRSGGARACMRPVRLRSPVAEEAGRQDPAKAPAAGLSCDPSVGPGTRLHSPDSVSSSRDGAAPAPPISGFAYKGQEVDLRAEGSGSPGTWGSLSLLTSLC